MIICKDGVVRFGGDTLEVLADFGCIANAMFNKGIASKDTLRGIAEEAAATDAEMKKRIIMDRTLRKLGL